MSDLNCRIEIPDLPGLKPQELTVGREFLLLCSGNLSNLDLQKAHFVWPEEQQKYSLKLLGVNSQNQELALKVTSYVAAKVSIPDLTLSDGQKKLSLGSVNFEVSSVLDPQQKQEPFGPMGPFSIEWPLTYTLFFIFMAVVFLSWVASLFWRRKKAKDLAEKLRELDTVLSPEAQFFKDLRQLKRENEVFIGASQSAVLIEARDKIEKMFKHFLSREMRVLATELKPKKLMKALKRQERWRVKNAKVSLEAEVATLIHEFEKSKMDQSKISNQDVMQLISQSQKIVEKIGRAGEVRA